MGIIEQSGKFELGKIYTNFKADVHGKPYRLVPVALQGSGVEARVARLYGNTLDEAHLVDNGTMERKGVYETVFIRKISKEKIRELLLVGTMIVDFGICDTDVYASRRVTREILHPERPRFG